MGWLEAHHVREFRERMRGGEMRLAQKGARLRVVTPESVYILRYECSDRLILALHHCFRSGVSSSTTRSITVTTS